MTAHQRVVTTTNSLLACAVQVHLYEVLCSKLQYFDGLVYGIMGSFRVLNMDSLTDRMTRATNRCVNNMCSGDPRLHLEGGGGAQPTLSPLDPSSRELPHMVTADVAEVVVRHYTGAIMDVIGNDWRVANPESVTADVVDVLRDAFLANAHPRYSDMLTELERICSVTVRLEFC
ncbi:hypothetical protein GGTG_09105 [Gaeumannomyces tritici R3-111a-1]|uniref:Uncharacterized protein n=1 Tax=Gaeumannomyces tritici (strain R3-111a-1) TaxID=644352 RepID=J3P6G5_GAET3|nr:hypothetical protein GGTG_09105 [Gaeumannomyces tritici R3-111a-1]EJT72239.1 hypothetical protein GGTG_09105 [Gaeumannomyces tritici R3-111a-1]